MTRTTHIHQWNWTEDLGHLPAQLGFISAIQTDFRWLFLDPLHCTSSCATWFYNATCSAPAWHVQTYWQRLCRCHMLQPIYNGPLLNEWLWSPCCLLAWSTTGKMISVLHWRMHCSIRMHHWHATPEGLPWPSLYPFHKTGSNGHGIVLMTIPESLPSHPAICLSLLIL